MCTPRYLTIYRTLADPAYLDLSIDPDDRPLGSLFAFPDPLDANYGRGGLARTMTARGWLSTWSGLSSAAGWPTPCPRVPCPHAARPPHRRHRDPRAPGPRDPQRCGADDVTYIEMKGAPHYLEGHRPEALARVADWIAERYP